MSHFIQKYFFLILLASSNSFAATSQLQWGQALDPNAPAGIKKYQNRVVELAKDLSKEEIPAEATILGEGKLPTDPGVPEIASNHE